MVYKLIINRKFSIRKDAPQRLLIKKKNPKSVKNESLQWLARSKEKEKKEKEQNAFTVFSFSEIRRKIRKIFFHVFFSRLFFVTKVVCSPIYEVKSEGFWPNLVARRPIWGLPLPKLGQIATRLWPNWANLATNQIAFEICEWSRQTLFNPSARGGKVNGGFGPAQFQQGIGVLLGFFEIFCLRTRYPNSSLGK